MPRPEPDTARPATPTLAVVIVAKNEATNIAACVASAAFANEILVLDSGSDDGTPAIARAAGARVVETDWPGYGPQVARGFSMVKSDWVFSLDADERIPASLQHAIVAAIGGGPLGGHRVGTCDGWRVARWSEFCGRVMRHGGWRPDRTLRLGRRDRADFTGDFLHAHMMVEGRIGDIDASLEHLSYPDIHDVLEKLDRYSSGSARDMQARGRKGGLGKAIVHALFAFLRTYVLRRGFLDGRHGLMLAIYNAEYAYYKYVKLMFLASPPAKPKFPA